MSSSCQGFFTPRVSFLYVCRREGFTHEGWRKELRFCIYAVVLYSVLCVFFFFKIRLVRERGWSKYFSIYKNQGIFTSIFPFLCLYYLRPYVACSFLVKSINEVVITDTFFKKRNCYSSPLMQIGKRIFTNL